LELRLGMFSSSCWNCNYKVWDIYSKGVEQRYLQPR
jgi:hypothetical protein